MGGVDCDDVTELVALAYEAGTEPKGWPRFLERFAQSIGDRSVTLQIEDLTNEQGTLAFYHGADPAVMEAYASHYGALNPWTRNGEHLLHTGRILYDEMSVSHRDLQRTEFYADFLEPQDIARSMCGVIARNQGTAAYISFQRSRNAGDWTQDEIALVGRVLPHLQRAIDLHRRLSAERRDHEALIETANRLPWGVVFLDEKRRVVFENEQVRHMDRALLARALGLVNSGGGIVTRPDRAPVAVMVSRLEAQDPLTLESRARVAVFLVDPEQRRASPDARLRQSFGLTPAEARLALALANGSSLAEIADEQRVTIETLRTHLKRIFDKTGTRRQSNLVRLVLLLSGLG